jgi:tetratricopeptide (TPR) repeat protein
LSLRKSPDAPYRLLLPILLALLLTACASGGMKSSAMKMFVSAISGYKLALHYYESGDIMLARTAAVNTPPSRPDYQQTQALLKKKIEPARLRLLHHYRLAAEKAEKQGVMYIALEDYRKAADLSVNDDRMQKDAERIDLVVRQRRLDQLSRQRRMEDEQLLDTLERYTPPNGLDPKDGPFERELERAQDRVLARGRNAWNAAKRELHEGNPEVAYVEAESYQRLRPGSDRGTMLMQEVREALPKSLHIPPMPGLLNHRNGKTSGMGQPVNVTSEQIHHLMDGGKWIQAREYAIIYRRNGGDDADALLEIIDKALKKQAELAFRRGQVAFQNEQLDKAVEAWSQAVELQPENSDYADSLRRAQELQESFRVLQSKAGNADN